MKNKTETIIEEYCKELKKHNRRAKNTQLTNLEEALNYIIETENFIDNQNNTIIRLICCIVGGNYGK